MTPAWALRLPGWLAAALARPIARITRLPRAARGLAIAFAVALLAALFFAWRADHIAAQRDHARAQARERHAALEVMRADMALRTLAEMERAADDRAISALEKELTNAIADQEDLPPSAMRVALGCVRLQQAGTPVSDLPLPCRSGD